MNPQEKNDTLTLKFEVTQPANDTQSVPTQPANENQSPYYLADLLRRIANGDKKAVGTIARIYGSTLFEEVESVMQGRDGAEDAVQDFYVFLLESRGVYPLGPPREWMLTMVRIIARKRRRERNREG